MTFSLKRMLIVAVAAGLAVFIGYRMVRPMNIFVVTEEFERPMVVAVPAGLASLSAADCGACHRDAYQEWTGSMHAQAWTDPYFQVDFTFDRSQQVCLNCHTPLSDQQENLVLGFRDRDKVQPILAPNDSFDEALRDEGVTCAVCHVRDGVIIGPFGDTDAPHPTRRDPGMTDGIGVCRQCHTWSLESDGIRSIGFRRVARSPRSRRAAKSPTVQAGHMPAIERPLVAGGAPRPSRRHLFRGGHDPDTVRRVLAVDVEMTGTEGGQRTAIVGVRNAGADHYIFPPRRRIAT